MSKKTAPTLTAEQQAAIAAAKAHFGRLWKTRLLDCWLAASYPTELKDHSVALQQIRNQLGPEWLDKIRD